MGAFASGDRRFVLLQAIDWLAALAVEVGGPSAGAAGYLDTPHSLPDIVDILHEASTPVSRFSVVVDNRKS